MNFSAAYTEYQCSQMNKKELISTVPANAVNYAFISTSTPEGKSSLLNASTVLDDEV
jgi:hypothetical protein